MRDVDEVRVDLADAHGLTRLHGDGLDIRELVFLEFAAQEREREVGAVNRHFELCEEVGHAADVVFVRVRQQQAAHLALALEQIGDLVDDQIDAEHLLFGELHPRVDDDDVIAGLIGRHVAADLAAAAERNDAQILLVARRFGQRSACVARSRDGEKLM